MSVLLHFIASLAILALGILAMAIGQILRKKSLSHCGSSSMSFRGEKIRCPGCLDPKGPDCPKLAKPEGLPKDR